MPFLDIARPLLEMGFSVIPLLERDKRPQPGIGALSRTRDISVVEAWAKLYPQANVGICADENVIILESDDYERFNALVKMGTGNDVPVTLTSCGSSDNRPHLFFRRTEKSDRVGNLAIGGIFEARFSNQYVVGPGSTHPSGATYRFIEVGQEIVPIPDWLVSELARLALSNKDRQSNQIVMQGETVPEGSRHYFLMQQAGRLWDGEIDEQEFYDRLSELNQKHCSPPREPEHVLQCVRDVMRREPYDAGPKVLIGGEEVAKFGPRNPTPSPDKDEYIVPGEGKLEGWFIKQELNLVVGASGAGKTTVMLQILENIRQANPVFGHPARQCEYRVVMHDRSARGFERTVKRMRLSQESRKRIYRLSRAEQQAPAVETLDKYLKKLEKAGQVPDVIFIEGLDFWAHEDINKQSVVESYCSDLIELAAAWDVALVGSVGCPKQKAKDRYQQSRDNINGSAAWGRKVETILFLMLSNPENPNSARKMEVLPRNGPAEIFHLGFEDGRLVEVADPDMEPEKPAGVEETKAKIKDRQSVFIEYLQALPAGMELDFNQTLWIAPASTVRRYCEALSHPETGWVEKVGGKWVVRKSNVSGG